MQCNLKEMKEAEFEKVARQEQQLEIRGHMSPSSQTKVQQTLNSLRITVLLYLKNAVIHHLG